MSIINAIKQLTYVAAITTIFCARLANAAESNESIKISLNDWTSQAINSYIIGGILEKNGYKVEYLTADYNGQLEQIEQGLITVGMEFWVSSSGPAVKKALTTGKVESFGTGMIGKEDWWFPNYMKEKCPGLPDWKALNKCAELFSNTDSFPKGVYINGPATWQGYDAERIAALGLDYQLVNTNTEEQEYQMLDEAYKKKQPFLGWIYTPHWVLNKYEGSFVEFPPYTDACYDSKKFNCDKPSGEIVKVVWIEAKNKWPKAYNIIKNYKITNNQINSLIAKVDLDKQDIKVVAKNWVESNEATWKTWAK